MTVAITRSTNPAIREVNRDLAAAQDTQILRAVAMVDAMPDRGQADQLVAPLRARLARLRPPRPLRFARLLFLPMDPLIVSPARWRISDATIPRTVIPVIAATLRQAMPDAEAVERLIRGRITAETDVVEHAGGMLWSRAATLLQTPPPPIGWDATGLALTAYLPLARRIGAMLSQADRLSRLANDAARGLSPPDIRLIQSMIAAATTFESPAQSMLIALLLSRVPEAAPVLARVATSLGPRGEALLRESWDDASGLLVDQLERPGAAEDQLGGADLTDASATARRLILLIAALETDTIPPARRDRLGQIRRRVAASCEALFTERMTAALLEPLRAGCPDPAHDIEAAARGLRALETEARRIAGGKLFDTLLSEASNTLRDAATLNVLERISAIRLMEILAGPEAAMSLLTGIPR